MLDTVLKAKDFSATPVDAEVRSLFSSALSANWRQAMVARGFGWHTDVGAFSTPAAGGGAAAIIDQDRPNLLVSVPTGWVLVPLRVHVACQIPLTAADSDESEILIAADIAAAAAGITTQTVVETPTNMRSNVTSGCPFITYSTLSANITNPTLGLELGHAVKTAEYQTDVGRNWTDLALLYEPLRPPFIVGPACLYVYYGGTIATTGFINADFLAVPSSLVTNLA